MRQKRSTAGAAITALCIISSQFGVDFTVIQTRRPRLGFQLSDCPRERARPGLWAQDPADQPTDGVAVALIGERCRRIALYWNRHIDGVTHRGLRKRTAPPYSAAAMRASASRSAFSSNRARR